MRFAVEGVTREREFQHRLRDFNNLPETRFADIKAVLAVALKRVRERLNAFQKNSSTRHKTALQRTAPCFAFDSHE